MKHFRKISISVIIMSIMIVFQSCKKEGPKTHQTTENPTVNLLFTASYQTQTFYLDSAYNSEVSQAYKLYFDILKFYISDVYLIGDNDSVKLTDVQLIDFKTNAPKTMFSKLKAKPGRYHKIRLGLGVNPILNATKPGSYDANSPLSSSQGTYCEMNNLYFFTLMMGRFDITNMGDNYNQSFTLQVVGFNNKYKTIDLPIPEINLINGISKDLNLDVDVYKLLYNAVSPTNFRVEAVSSHTDDALSTLIQNNLAIALKAK